MSVPVSATAEAARLIAAARLARKPLALLPPEVRPPDEGAAYAVQRLLHERLTDAGLGVVAGYKIGCTTPVMQQYLGIASPCAGGVFSTAIHASGCTIDHRQYCRVGIECEIALRLGRALDPANAPFTAESAAAAVDACMAAVEIVDDRYFDWRQIGTPTLIADDFFGAGCALGPAVAASAAPDLAGVAGDVRIKGVEVGRGTGADVMGHPYRALAWLANNLAGRGCRLDAGMVVLSGSVVQTRWLSPGDRVAVTLRGLGTVELLNG